MKKILPILFAAIASFVIVYVIPQVVGASKPPIIETSAQYEESLIEQNVLGVKSEIREISKIYDTGKLLGVLSDKKVLDTMLDEVYKEKYEIDFPKSTLDVGKDIYIINEMSYNEYENVDEQIGTYLKDKNSFTVQTNAIEFYDENGTFATIYVDDIAKYEEALNQYLKYFIDEESLNALRNNQTIPELTSYGTKSTSIEVLQNTAIKKAYADPSEIMKTANEVKNFLEYGTNEERRYYTVVAYDMVEGVGSKNGLSADQVVNINSSLLKNTEQVLEPGTELCVTYFESPIDIVVKKEAMKKEPVYPGETIYIDDESMLINAAPIVEQEAIAGLQNVLYEETWINGVLVKGDVVSSIVTSQPQQEIVRKGTKEIPGVGTGTFRWPIDNVNITCRWGCYGGHQAIDLQNRYERYGNIYAADRGTICEVGYTNINGNYMIIDHNNGYKSYYGHMNKPTEYKVGDRVDKGQVIGQLGMTGIASGPHVHFFIMLDDVRRNPCDGYLDC